MRRRQVLATPDVMPSAAARIPTSVELFTFQAGSNLGRAVLERAGDVWHLRCRWRRRTLVFDLLFWREHQLERALREAAHYFEVSLTELDQVLPCDACRFSLDAEHMGRR